MNNATREALADAAFEEFDAWENDRTHNTNVTANGWTAQVCEWCHGSGHGETQYCGDGCCSWTNPCESCTDGFTDAQVV